MKRIVDGWRTAAEQSRPARARGLKPAGSMRGFVESTVAPRTGAWIETDEAEPEPENPVVAPRTGAWIETHLWSWGFVGYPVAPRTGAWIETKGDYSPYEHPPVAPRTGAWIETRILTVTEISAVLVAPRTGAWIETPYIPGVHRAGRVAPRTGAWIETMRENRSIAGRCGRAPHGRVD